MRKNEDREIKNSASKQIFGQHCPAQVCEILRPERAAVLRGSLLAIKSTDTILNVFDPPLHIQSHKERISDPRAYASQAELLGQLHRCPL